MKCEICEKDIPIKDIITLSAGKLQSGIICKDCRKYFPSVLSLAEYQPETVKNIIEYEKECGAGFECTAHLGNLFLDEMNLMFAYSERGREEPKRKNNVFRVKDIDDIALSLSEPTVMRGNIYCDILLTVHIHSPRLHFCRPIKRRVYCECERVDAKSVRYEEPKELAIIRSLFNQMIVNSVSEMKKLLYLQGRYREQIVDGSLREAEILFMLDEGYTYDDVKQSRNLLMKAFHPDINDIDDKYAQKINEAFKVLRKECKK